MTTAVAHPNIALIKYWGKGNKDSNTPATPSLSITLDALATRTTVERAQSNTLVLNGEERRDDKIERWLASLGGEFNLPPLSITTENNFPTGAGLASSASGFAALACAINQHCGLGLTPQEQSVLARRGSASAARSLFGGFVTLAGPSWQAESYAEADHWGLGVVVAVTSETAKAVSSSVGMELSRQTSPYYEAWTATTVDDFDTACTAVDQRDFSALAAVAEHSCLKMHALMQSTVPPLVYWNEATVAAMNTVRGLQQTDTPVFFTIDAGPQLKAVCLPEAVDRVGAALANTPGVVRTITSTLGAGAHVVG